MNRARVAAILRELATSADLLRELANELEQVDEPAEAPRARRRVRHVRSDIVVDDTTRARARSLLRRAGVAPR